MEEVKIIFEDKEVLVVEKPAFMTTTKEKKEEKGTLEDFLREFRPNDLPRNGIVHRLDKGTSGLVMMAKTEESFLGLKKQFKERTLIKQYYCLVGGDVSFEGEINMPIDRSKYVFAKFGVSVDGKKALTEFRVIKKYKKEEKIYSLLSINLKTGRTHQIRVHLSYLRWPLVGDRVYGGEVIDDLKRPFLHAFKIVFEHPTSGQKINLEIDLPNDLKEVLKNYEEQ
ncbi:MAG: RluA family pseudouridine synthase [Candidatus Shapirobacteria bacterium]|jgi:23S rRNA pseudouridine1911/1915/1917 synthase